MQIYGYPTHGNNLEKKRQSVKLNIRTVMGLTIPKPNVPWVVEIDWHAS